MRLLLAPVLALPLFLGACDQWDTDTSARDRATAVLDCTSVEMTKVEDNHYRAVGCGRTIEVLCTAAELEPECVAMRPRGEGPSRLSEVGSGGEEEADTTPAPTGDDILRQQAAMLEPADPDADDDAPLRIPEAPAEPQANESEQTIRRGLDARREDVLACADRNSVVVNVAYAADGSVAITLAGDLRGSPQEGCVRAALQGVRVAEGQAGVVMHLLRR
jgi:hypothetical protein